MNEDEKKEKFQEIKKNFPIKRKVILTKNWKDKKEGNVGEVVGHFPPPACLVTVDFGKNDCMSFKIEEIESSVIIAKD